MKNSENEMVSRCTCYVDRGGGRGTRTKRCPLNSGTARVNVFPGGQAKGRSRAQVTQTGFQEICFGRKSLTYGKN